MPIHRKDFPLSDELEVSTYQDGKHSYAYDIRYMAEDHKVYVDGEIFKGITGLNKAAIVAIENFLQILNSNEI